MQRMSDERLPKAIFYSELAEGSRSIGRPKKRYKDHLQDTMKKCDISPGSFEITASDRSAWKQAVRRGTSHYETILRNQNDLRRNARHGSRATAATGDGHHCQKCDRSFRNVASHLRAYLRARQRQQREDGRLRFKGQP